MFALIKVMPSQKFAGQLLLCVVESMATIQGAHFGSRASMLALWLCSIKTPEFWGYWIILASELIKIATGCIVAGFDTQRQWAVFHPLSHVSSVGNVLAGWSEDDRWLDARGMPGWQMSTTSRFLKRTACTKHHLPKDRSQ